MILSNQVECLICHDKPYSASVHDFRYCKCSAIAVDGGMEYTRRIAGNLANIRDMSISVDDDAVALARDAIKKAIGTKRNDLGILCAVAIALRDAGYDIVKRDEK